MSSLWRQWARCELIACVNGGGALLQGPSSIAVREILPRLRNGQRMVPAVIQDRPLHAPSDGTAVPVGAEERSDQGLRISLASLQRRRFGIPGARAVQVELYRLLLALSAPLQEMAYGED